MAEKDMRQFVAQDQCEPVGITFNDVVNEAVRDPDPRYAILRRCEGVVLAHSLKSSIGRLARNHVQLRRPTGKPRGMCGRSYDQ